MFAPYRPQAVRHLPPFAFQPVARERLRVATPEQLRALNERGYFVWEGAFGPDELGPLRAELDRSVDRAQQALRRAGGRIMISEADGIVFAPHVVARSEVARRFSSHPEIAGLCCDLLGPDVRLYWDQAVYKYPSFAKEFPWHQDNGYTYVEPQFYLTLWIALTDATPENGCVEVVPGSHREGTREHRTGDGGYYCHEGDDGVCVPLRAGSVAVFTSLTVHRTGPNRTADSVRRTYILQYAPDGAVAYPRGGEPTPCSAPERQFLVVRGGDPCPAPRSSSSS